MPAGAAPHPRGPDGTTARRELRRSGSSDVHAVESGADEHGATRTTILVTHRLANVRHAERIVVLSGGRIVEQGRHDDLLAARGLYHGMYETQAAAYRAPSDVDVPGASARCADADGVEVGLHDR